MAFLMAHWRTILLIYAVIGGLVFLGVLLFFAWAAYTDARPIYRRTLRLALALYSAALTRRVDIYDNYRKISSPYGTLGRRYERK